MFQHASDDAFMRRKMLAMSVALSPPPPNDWRDFALALSHDPHDQSIA